MNGLPFTLRYVYFDYPIELKIVFRVSLGRMAFDAISGSGR